MLRDARTGVLTQVRLARRRELRLLIAAADDSPSHRTELGQVRCRLSADLLRRFAERTGLLPAVIDLLPPGQDAAEPGANAAHLRARCEALNIYPPRGTLISPAAPTDLAAFFPAGAAGAAGAGWPPFDVGIAVGDPPAEVADWAPLWIRVAGEGDAPDLAAEPLAVRLTLLGHGYDEPVPGDGTRAEAGAELSAESADEAAAALARWRGLVAEWAKSPSGAMSRRHDEAVLSAFADNLNTSAALAALAGLADEAGIPDGVKFETFATADRLLGLDLARDVGR